MIESLSAAICGAYPPASTDKSAAAQVVQALLERRSIKMIRSAPATHLLPSAPGTIVSAPDVEGSGPGNEPIPISPDAIAWAARALRHYEMPPEEISAVLWADNPELVRRYMELHREWLGERLVDRLRALAGLERFLVQAILAARESRPACGQRFTSGKEMTMLATHENHGERPRPASPDHSARD